MSKAGAEDSDRVILVDSEDRELGSMGKMRAHREGRLHRAFSVFVFNDAGEMLLQRRAAAKYHSGGLWSNACCSHPRPGESVLSAAHRRLGEEMGFDCELSPAFRFQYRAELGHGLIEHELDHVLLGHYSGVPEVNAEEADASAFLPVGKIRRDMAGADGRYTVWFRLCFARVIAHLEALDNAGSRKASTEKPLA